MVTYICKYTPIELFAGFGEDVNPIDGMKASYPLADQAGHMNLCGFSKSILESVLSGEVENLVLVNCCDVMRRVYDIVKQSGKCRFLFFMDLPRTDSACSRLQVKQELLRLKDAYASYSGKTFDYDRFLSSFVPPSPAVGEHVAIVGARVDSAFVTTVQKHLSLPVEDHTCLGNRFLLAPSGNDLMLSYASELLSQLPCRRMADTRGRACLYEDPTVSAFVFHAMKFCDYSQMEYREMEGRFEKPVIRLETDYTLQGDGQLSTRLDAFAETLGKGARETMELQEGHYVAGIDSGSTSTDVVLMDRSRRIVASMIVPTGGGARLSAEACLSKALEKASIKREAVQCIVATGYGREYLPDSESITEISCHAKGAFYLDPTVRTIIDIGGQDSKAIKIDGEGHVLSFAMNDKCAAGTGRFLEMMARTLGLSIEELASLGVTCKEKLTISNMCTVFAESEVVSLVAQSKDVGDIVHALDASVAQKVSSLVARVTLNPPCMLTGGVAQNAGVVHAIEEKLGIKLVISPFAQLCGAIGAAIYALPEEKKTKNEF